MADVRILKIDEDKSRFSDSSACYVFILTEEPDKRWNSNLSNAFSRSKNTQITSLRVKGSELILNARNDVSPEQVVETLHALIMKVNFMDDEFRNKLKALNKRLASSGR